MLCAFYAQFISYNHFTVRNRQYTTLSANIKLIIYIFQLCIYTVKPAHAVTCIKRSPFSGPVIENFIWIEPLLRCHQSYKATFALFQRWPLNTGLTVYVCVFICLYCKVMYEQNVKIRQTRLGSVGWACVSHLSFCFEET